MRYRSSSRKSVKDVREPDGRDDLVLKHLPTVKAIAMQLRRKLPEHVDFDDLIQAGTLGLLDAADKFDSAKSVPFGIYARHRIKGAIIDSLRQGDWATREIRRQQRRVREVTHELSAQFQRAPREEEVAEKMGMSLDDWRRMMLNLRIEFLSVSPGRSGGGSEDLPSEHFADKVEHHPDRLCAHNQLRELLDQAIGTLTERERKTLNLHYHSGLPLREISQSFGVHESRTSQIHRAALQKLAAVFQSAGIHSSIL